MSKKKSEWSHMQNVKLFGYSIDFKVGQVGKNYEVGVKAYKMKKPATP